MLSFLYTALEQSLFLRNDSDRYHFTSSIKYEMDLLHREPIQFQNDPLPDTSEQIQTQMVSIWMFKLFGNIPDMSDFSVIFEYDFPKSASRGTHIWKTCRGRQTAISRRLVLCCAPSYDERARHFVFIYSPPNKWRNNSLVAHVPRSKHLNGTRAKMANAICRVHSPRAIYIVTFGRAAGVLFKRLFVVSHSNEFFGSNFR